MSTPVYWEIQAHGEMLRQIQRSMHTRTKSDGEAAGEEKKGDGDELNMQDEVRSYRDEWLSGGEDSGN